MADGEEAEDLFLAKLQELIDTDADEGFDFARKKPVTNFVNAANCIESLSVTRITTPEVKIPEPPPVELPKEKADPFYALLDKAMASGNAGIFGEAKMPTAAMGGFGGQGGGNLGNAGLPPEQPAGAFDAPSDFSGNLDEAVSSSKWKDRKIAYEHMQKLFSSKKELEEQSHLLPALAKEKMSSAAKEAILAIKIWTENAPESALRNCFPAFAASFAAGPALAHRWKPQLFTIMTEFLRVVPFKQWAEGLAPALRHRNKKIPPVYLEFIAQAILDFGVGVIDPSVAMAIAVEMSSNTQPLIKKNAQLIIVNILKWVGDVFDEMLSTQLKAVTFKAIRAEIQKWESKKEKLQPTKFLRGMSRAAESGAKNRTVIPKIDPTAGMKAVDPLKELGNEWIDELHEVVTSTWKIKKARLDALLAEVKKSPKVKAGDGFPVVANFLMDMVNDDNVLVKANALECINQYSGRMPGDDWRPYGQILVNSAMPLFKSKKLQIVRSLPQVLQTMFEKTLGWEGLQDAFMTSFSCSLPKVRWEAWKFFCGCCKVEEKRGGLRYFINDGFTKIITKAALTDGDKNVRTFASEALGHVIGITQDPGLSKFFIDLENENKTAYKRVKNILDTYGGVVVVPETQEEDVKEIPQSEDSPSRGISVDIKKRRPTPKRSSKPKKKIRAKKGSRFGRNKPSLQAERGESKDCGPAPPNQAVEAKDNSENMHEGAKQLTFEEARERIEELEIEELNFDVTKVVEKAKTLEAFAEACKNKGADMEDYVDAVIYLLNTFPGYRVTIPKQAKSVLKILECLANTCTLTADLIRIPLMEIAAKTGDAKFKQSASSVLFGFAENVGPKYIIPQIFKRIKEIKNPKFVAGALRWIVECTREFGVSATNYMFSLNQAQTMIAGSRGDAKVALAQLITEIYRQCGNDAFKLICCSGLGPKDFKRVSELMAAIPPEELGNFNPTRKVRGEEFPLPLNLDELLPRKDISKKLEAVIAKLDDKSWQTRKKGLEEIEGLIFSCAGRIKPNMSSSFLNALKWMLKDKNKNLIPPACKSIAALVQAAGPPLKKHNKIIFVDLLVAMGDPKKTISEKAKETADIWIRTVGIESTFRWFGDVCLEDTKPRALVMPLYLEHVLSFVKGGGNLKNLDWDAAQKGILKCMLDRRGVVKKAAQQLGTIMVETVGLKAIQKSFRDFKPTEREEFNKLLRKTTAQNEEKETIETKSASALRREMRSKKEDEDKRGGHKKGRSNRWEKKKPSDADDDVPLKPSTKKDVRLKRKRRYKGCWVEFSPSELKNMTRLFEPIASKSLKSSLWGQNFRDWKLVFQTLSKTLESSDTSSIVSNSDLLLMWVSWRMTTENNPQLDALCLNFFNQIIHRLITEKEMLDPNETDSFLPAVIEKGLGNNRSNILNVAKDIIDSVANCMDINILMIYLWDATKSKNNRVQTESLFAIHRLMMRLGNEIVSSSKIGKKKMVQELGKMLEKASATVRKPILEILVLYYHELGPELFRIIGKKLKIAFSMTKKRMKNEKFEGAKDNDNINSESSNQKRSRPMKGINPCSPATRESVNNEEKSKPIQTEPSLAPAIPAQSTFSTEQSTFPPTGYHPGASDNSPFSATTFNREAALSVFDLDFSKFEDLRTAAPTISGDTSGIGDMPHLRTFPGLPEVQPTSDTNAPPLSKALSETNFESLYNPAFLLLNPVNQPKANNIDLLLNNLQMRRICGLEDLNDILENMDEDWEYELLDSINTIVGALSSWLQYLVENYGMYSDEELIGLSVKLLQSMVLISDNVKLLHALTREVLADYIRILLVTLISPVIRANFPNKRLMITKLNKITLAVLQNCDRTSAFYILLQLLKLAEPFPVKNEQNRLKSSQFSNLVVKCLAKKLSGIPLYYKDIDVRLVLLLIHEFFDQIPPSEWEQPGANDKPIVCVKTCLSKFCDAMGSNIIVQVNEITKDAREPPLIRELVEEYLSRERKSSRSPIPDSSKQRVLERQMASAREIVYRIKERDPQAPSQLHSFLLNCRALTLEEVIASESDINKRYIIRHLEDLDSAQGTEVVPRRSFTQTSRSSKASNNSVEKLRKRLQAIHSGKTQHKNHSDRPRDKPRSQYKTPTSDLPPEKATPAPTQRDEKRITSSYLSVDEIKARLAKLRSERKSDSLKGNGLKENQPPGKRSLRYSKSERRTRQ